MTPVARVAAPAAVAFGAALIALGLLTKVVPAATQPQALVPVLALALGGGALAVLRPRWLLPAWAGLTWASIGEHWFGGLPSPVQTGAIVLLAAGLWFHREDVVALRRVALVSMLIALPALASSVLTLENTGMPVDLMRALPFLAVGALVVRDDDDLELLSVGFALTGLILGVGAAWSVLVGPTELFGLNESSAVFEYEAPRAAGPIGEANFFALTLAVLVPFALHLARSGGWRSWLGGLSTLALAAGVLATGSRGGAAAAIAGVVVFAVLAGGRTARVVAVLSIAGAIVMVPLFVEQTGGAGERTTQGRLTENRVALSMFADRPLIGIGPGAYPIAYRDYAREVGSDPRVQREAHSLPLEILAEQGIAGAAGWIAVVVLVASALRAGAVRLRPPGQALVAALIAYGAGSLFLHGSQLRMLLLLMGVGLAAGRIGERKAAAP